MKINIRKLSEGAIIPTRGSSQSAGVDLYSSESAEVEAGQTTMIKTGLSIEIPDGYFGAVFARSGLASRAGLRPANCVGVIDSDYRGEVIVALHNDSDVTRQVEKGERIAQLVILPYLSVEFNEVEELSETERQAGGFGSTGK
ncbi:MAG: dUTP diphosphatase [Erysipelotrichaceae bacterium]|nr:dUTP diphosphatase [Erysipelotrichaceae bacterium]